MQACLYRRESFQSRHCSQNDKGIIVPRLLRVDSLPSCQTAVDHLHFCSILDRLYLPGLENEVVL